MVALMQHPSSRIIPVCMAALFLLTAAFGMRQASADTQQEQARKHYEAGRDLYASGDYRAAIREFETANRLAPSPVLDFNIGLAYERLGVLDQALTHYKAYINAMPGATNRAAVDAKIQSLERELAAASAPEPIADTTTPMYEPVDTVSTDPAGKPAQDPAVVTAEPAAEPAVPRGVNPPSAPVYQATGDAQLDRAAAIDLAELRAQRAGHLASVPGSGNAGSVAENVDQPSSPPTKKAKPVYKKWWFWVVVGVSAVILIDMANGSDGNQTSTVRDMPGSPVLIRF